MTHYTNDEKLNSEFEMRGGRAVRPSGMRWAVFCNEGQVRNGILAWFRAESAAVKYLRKLARSGHGRLHLLHCR